MERSGRTGVRGRATGRNRRGATTLVVGLAVVLLAPIAACSGGGTSVGPDEAANAVAGVFSLPDDARTCLKGRFESDSTARGLVNSTDEPTAAERTALVEAVDACMTEDQFAAAIAARITAGLPPADSTGTAAQIDCLTTALLGLTDTQHDDLLVGLLVLGAPPTGELGLARGDVLNGLYSTCGITPGG